MVENETVTATETKSKRKSQKKVGKRKKRSTPEQMAAKKKLLAFSKAIHMDLTKIQAKLKKLSKA